MSKPGPKGSKRARAPKQTAPVSVPTTPRARPAKKAPPRAASTPTSPTRCGTIAIVGRPNVGKSTLVNALLGFRLAITTPKPQTTRDRILGVLTRGDAQLVFLDTPGLHAPRNKLGARMNAEAEEATRGADVVVFVTDLPLGKRGATRGPATPTTMVDDETLRRVREAAGPKVPIILALNKVDRLKDKTALFALLGDYAALGVFAALVPMTASRGGEGKPDGLEGLLDEIAARLPEGPFLFAEDELTDRPERFLVAEHVREQVIRQTRDELPYAIAVTIDAWEEPATEKAVTRVEATIHVDKEAQRKIVIGQGGERIKAIGMAARRRVEELLGRRVHLGLYVRVDERWQDDDRKLADLGYR